MCPTWRGVWKDHFRVSALNLQRQLNTTHTLHAGRKNFGGKKFGYRAVEREAVPKEVSILEMFAFSLEKQERFF